MEYAYTDYLDKHGADHPLDYISSSDALVCFCSDKSNRHKEIEVMTPDGETTQVNLCRQRAEYSNFLAWMRTKAFRIGVVIFSLILRQGYTKLTEVVGYANLTSKHVSLLWAVSVIYFATWGLIYLIGPINLNKFNHNLLERTMFGRGLYADINLEWCKDIGD